MQIEDIKHIGVGAAVGAGSGLISSFVGLELLFAVSSVGLLAMAGIGSAAGCGAGLVGVVTYKLLRHFEVKESHAEIIAAIVSAAVFFAIAGFLGSLLAGSIAGGMLLASYCAVPFVGIMALGIVAMIGYRTYLHFTIKGDDAPCQE